MTVVLQNSPAWLTGISQADVWPSANAPVAQEIAAIKLFGTSPGDRLMGRLLAVAREVNSALAEMRSELLNGGPCKIVSGLVCDLLAPAEDIRPYRLVCSNLRGNGDTPASAMARRFVDHMLVTFQFGTLHIAFDAMAPRYNSDRPDVGAYVFVAPTAEHLQQHVRAVLGGDKWEPQGALSSGSIEGCVIEGFSTAEF